MPKLALPLILVVAASACSTTRQPTAERFLQKRRFQPGWHLDLGTRAHREQMKRRTSVPLLARRDLVRAIPSGGPLTTSVAPGTVPWDIPYTNSTRTGTVIAPVAPSAPVALVEVGPEPLEPAVVEPDARWNPWTGPALVLAIGTVAYGLVGTSLLVLALGVIATMILASIAVRKGRTYEWRGKGMAVAALVIGSLAALITLIALLGA